MLGAHSAERAFLELMTGGIDELAGTRTMIKAVTSKRQRVARALPRAEHALQRSQLAVDGGIGGLLHLPVSDIVDGGFGPAEGFRPLARYSWSAGRRGRRRVLEPHAILKRVVRGRVDPDHGHGRVHHVLQRVIIPTETLKVPGSMRPTAAFRCYGESASKGPLNRCPSEPAVIDKYSGHDDKVTLRQGVVLVLGDLPQINADAPESLRDVGAHPVRVRGQDHRLSGNPLHVSFEAQVSLLRIGRPGHAQHDHRREGVDDDDVAVAPGSGLRPAQPSALRSDSASPASVPSSRNVGTVGDRSSPACR